MQFLSLVPLRKILFITTIILAVTFFGLLIIANNLNRNGIAEAAKLENKIIQLKDSSEKLNQAIATYSSLLRVEQRARELGFEKVKHVEYIK